MKLGTRLIFLLATAANYSFAIAEQPSTPTTCAELKQEVANKCSNDNATPQAIEDCLKKEYARLVAIVKTRKKIDEEEQTQSPEEIMGEVRAFLPPM